MASVNRRVLPGFSLTLGLHRLLPQRRSCCSRSRRASRARPSLVVATSSGARCGRSGRGRRTCSPSAPRSSPPSVNLFLGLLIAWVLVRYQFPGKRLIDSLVDLPLALPTAVGGLVYASLYVQERLARAVPGAAGHQGRLHAGSAIVLVLIFVGLPFVVRTVQPVLEDLDAETEEAAASLGATRWQTFRRVILPTLYPGAHHRLRAGLRALRWASTARSSSSPATCRTGPRSRRS